MTTPSDGDQSPKTRRRSARAGGRNGKSRSSRKNHEQRRGHDERREIVHDDNLRTRGAADLREEMEDGSRSALLGRLVQEANARVLETALAAGSAAAGISTTLVACLLRYDRAAIAHVGDSRCYLIRRGRATQLTRDHTVACEHIRLGLVSAEEALETRHLLSRSLGADLFVGVETAEHALAAGDVLALCSDGLHASLAGEDLARSVSEHADLTAAAQTLVELANQRDGSDNISVQLIRIRSVERVGMYRGRPYRLR